MKHALIIILITSFTNLSAMAIAQSGRLISDMNDSIYHHALLKKNQLEAYLQFICQHKRFKDAKEAMEADRNKDVYIAEVLKLFVGYGEEIEDDGGLNHLATIVSFTTILPNGKIREYKIKLNEFLRRAKYLKYSELHIDELKVLFVIEMKEVGNDEFLATMEMRSLSNPRIRNCSPQTFKMKLRRVEVDGRRFWPIYFGDMSLTIINNE